MNLILNHKYYTVSIDKEIVKYIQAVSLTK